MPLYTLYSVFFYFNDLYNVGISSFDRKNCYALKCFLNGNGAVEYLISSNRTAGIAGTE